MTVKCAPPYPPTTYSSVLRARYVARLLAGTLIGRLPNSMAPIAIILLTTGEGNRTLAFAGALSALYILGSALSQPVKGALLARYGQTRVSAPTAVINAGGLIGLTVVDAAGSALVITLLVGVAGVCTPPLEAGLRALWPTVLPHPRQRRAALALDTGTQGCLFVAGPLLAVYLASTYHPSAALIATATLGLTGSALVLTTGPSRAWRADSTGRAAARSPLRNAGLRLIFGGLAGVGFGVGAMSVWAAEMSDAYRMDLLAGLIPGCFFAGSLVGGLIWGRRSWPGSTATQLLATVLGFTVGWLPLLTVPGPFAASVLAALPGLFLPLAIACAYITAESLAPAGATPKAYAWLILSYGVGTSAGTAIAGAAAEYLISGPLLAAAGGCTALALIARARSRFARARPPATHADSSPQADQAVAA